MSPGAGPPRMTPAGPRPHRAWLSVRLTAARRRHARLCRVRLERHRGVCTGDSSCGRSDAPHWAALLQVLRAEAPVGTTATSRETRTPRRLLPDS